MFLRPCPHCAKKIPTRITVCPYCHRNEAGELEAAQAEETAALREGEDRLVQDLKESAGNDAFAREQAIERMFQQGQVVVPALLKVLSQQSHPALPSVARVLGRLRDRRAVPVLVQAMKMGNEDLRTAAVRALSEIRDPEALPALLEEADRQDPALQAYLAHTLGSFQDERVVPSLVKLAKHRNREVAFQAVYALGETNVSTVVPLLQDLFGGRDALIRAAAAAALQRLGAPVRNRRLRRWIMIGIGGVVALAGGLMWFVSH